MDSTGKDLLDTQLPQEPERLFHLTAKLLGKYDTLSYMDGFKPSKEDTNTFEKYELKIIECLSALFSASYTNNFFWYDCPFFVYKETLNTRFKSYQLKEPELTLNNFLIEDYKRLFNLPLFKQRFLWTDEVYIGLDYGMILNKPKRDNTNPVLLYKAEEVKSKFERARKEKMDLIQGEFFTQGKMIFNTGVGFNVQDIPIAEKVVEVKEQHNHIFYNGGFKLFEYLLSNFVTDGRGRKSDIAYFYWRLYNDDRKFIHARPEPFKEWFSTQYQEDIGKLKSLDVIKNPNRDNALSNALKWWKEQ